MLARTLLATSALALAIGGAASANGQTGFDIEAFGDGFSAEQLLGTTVAGAGGETLGDVQSAILTADGALHSVVVEVGGVFDVGDKAIAVPWDELSYDPDDERLHASSVSAETVDQFSLFADRETIEPEGARFRAKAILGDYVKTNDERYFGYVSDVIFDAEGQVGAVVVTPDIIYPTAQFLAFPFSPGEGFDPEADILTVDVAEADLVAYEPFAYREWIGAKGFGL